MTDKQQLTPHPVLVPWSRKGRAIPLLPLWAVWPVQSLSARTRVHFTFTFTHIHYSDTESTIINKNNNSDDVVILNVP